MSSSAHDDRDDAALAACARSSLACVSIAGEPGPGVTPDGRPRAVVQTDAAAWVRPAGVAFDVDEAPRVAGPWLVLRGVLRNRTDAAQRVFLVEAGAGFFHATLVGEGLVRRPPPPADPAGVAPPPHLFPEPCGYELAPGASWPFEVRVALPCWDLPPGRTVRVHWWFAFAREPAQGEMSL